MQKGRLDRQAGRKVERQTVRHVGGQKADLGKYSLVPFHLNLCLPACLQYTEYSMYNILYILYTVLFIYGKSDARPHGGGCKIYCKTWAKLDRTLFKAAGTYWYSIVGYNQAAGTV